MTRIHERIRRALENTPSLTQKGLAERMGLNPAAVNRMLHGQRKIMAEEIPVIEGYIGQRLGLGGVIAPDGPAPRQDDPPRRVLDEPARAAAPLPPQAFPIPAYRLDADGLRPEGDAADWLARHPAQSGSREAFAVFIVDEDMAPRYFPGEIAYIHPTRPPEAGRDVLLTPHEGAPFIARLVKDGPESLRVAPYGREKERDVPKSSLRAALAVVGRG